MSWILGDMAQANLLERLNAERTIEVEKIRDRVRAKRAARPLIANKDSVVGELMERITKLTGIAADEFDVAWVERKRHNADLALRVPSLLKTKPTPEYIKGDVPRMAAALEPLLKDGTLREIKPQGIYLNLGLSDSFLVGGLSYVTKQAERYGENSSFENRHLVVDYSSPNVAKHLHAGHIRSTILGHVLCNLYDASGGTPYRFNYVNDWGGFGELLEAYKRWSTKAPAFEHKNDLLFHLYTIFRTAERLVTPAAFTAATTEEKALLTTYFGTLTSAQELAAQFAEFKAQARVQFAALERGEEAALKIWQQMVEWSLQDFSRFYKALRIEHDMVVGESFYLQRAQELAERELKKGRIVRYSEAMAAALSAEIEQAVTEKKIGEDEATALRADSTRDINGFVVPLDNFRRLVIQRSDGATIYATRDVAGIDHRTKTFTATDLVYVVGQEQSDHFASIFEAAHKLDLVTDAVSMRHIYFGFYVDPSTKKKLSSRKGASNVNALLQGAVEYFRAKYNDEPEIPDEEKDVIAHRLAIGSLVYNDLRRDKKLDVEISPDPAVMCPEFEKAGGAYVMYTACRAKSVLRKAQFSWGALPVDQKLEPAEAELLKAVYDLPRRVAGAARGDNPSLLINYLESLATQFNSYYNSYPMIKGGVRHEHRLAIAAAVATALENGLRICHIECPERI